MTLPAWQFREVCSVPSGENCVSCSDTVVVRCAQTCWDQQSAGWCLVEEEDSVLDLGFVLSKILAVT